MPFKERPDVGAVRVRLEFDGEIYVRRGLKLVRRLRSPKPVVPPRARSLGTWYYTTDADGQPLHWFSAPNLLQGYSEGLVDEDHDPEAEGLLGLRRNEDLPGRLDLYIPADRRAVEVVIHSYEALESEPNRPTDFVLQDFTIPLDWESVDVNA